MFLFGSFFSVSSFTALVLAYIGRWMIGSLRVVLRIFDRDQHLSPNLSPGFPSALSSSALPCLFTFHATVVFPFFPSFLPPLAINSPPAFLPFFAHSYLESPQPMSPQRLSHIPPSLLITLPQGLLELDIADRIYVDPDTTTRFSTDFGRLTRAPPSAVLYPSSPDDIAALVRFSYFSPHPFTVAARGCGHSVRGQALAPGGVVVDMPSLGRGRDDRINVSRGDGSSFWYVDAGGEQLWIDVLHEALKHGLAPRSWTDYLHLTVGGTLSNAGVSGQAFRHGPQISNVYELEVVTGRISTCLYSHNIYHRNNCPRSSVFSLKFLIDLIVGCSTGKGEMMRCSHNENPALFYGVLGGLGQLGIITRARIAVEPAPERVRWARLIYTDFVSFTRDQELLISMSEEGFDYVEGSLLMRDHSLIGNWRSSFFSDRDWEKVKLLASQFGAIYCLEGAVYYELATASSVDQVKVLILLSSPMQLVGLVPTIISSQDPRRCTAEIPLDCYFSPTVAETNTHANSCPISFVIDGSSMFIHDASVTTACIFLSLSSLSQRVFSKVPYNL